MTDRSGKTTTETVLIDVGGENTAPICGIVSPLSGDAYLYGSSVIFQATASDADIPATDLTVTWESDRDGYLGNSIVETVGETSFIADGLTPGNHVIAMRVEDKSARPVWTQCYSISMKIRPQTLIRLRSTHLSNKTETLTCDVVASDVDGRFPSSTLPGRIDHG